MRRHPALHILAHASPRSLTALAGLFLLSASAAAHGAAYQPPVFRPGDTASIPGPARATPASPTLPRSPARGTPGPSSPVSGSSMAAAAPGSGPVTELFDPGLWTWWWEFNKEPFLALKRHLYAGDAESGEDGYFLGHGYRRQLARENRRPSDAVVSEHVLPALLRALEEEGSNDLAGACLVAVARIGEDLPREERVALERALLPHLASANQEVSETAAAALGILGNESAALHLGEVLLDTESGRRRVGKGRVPPRTRAFAAYGLGLLGNQTTNEDVRRFVVHKLASALLTEDEATPDVGIACVLSLGCTPLPYRGHLPEAGERKHLLPSASREAQIVFLLEVLDDERGRHRLVRAHVPTALGRLLVSDRTDVSEALRVEVAEELLARLEGRRNEPLELRQSCVIALGLVGDNDGDPIDRRIRDALAGEKGDRHARNLALLSYGRVAGRSGHGAAHELDEARTFLLQRAARDNDSGRWAGLGLALLERGLLEGPGASAAGSAFTGRLDEAGAPLDIGAAAIACGIAVHGASAVLLAEKLEDTAEDASRGHVALALGLVGAQESAEDLARIVDGATYRPQLLRDAAIGLALLGDRRVAGDLVARLKEADSLAAQASLAQALGRIGDASAIEPLLELLEDEERTGRARAFAAVALGIVCDRDELPWNTVLSVDTNYAAAPPTLFDTTGFGLLNLL